MWHVDVSDVWQTVKSVWSVLYQVDALLSLVGCVVELSLDVWCVTAA